MAFTRIVFLVVAMVHCNLVNATLTSCNATYLIEEKAATITCYFGSDVSNKTHEAFSVMHYAQYADSVTGIGKYVLECQYRAVKGDLSCDINANYTFNKNVKDHIILEIPNATSFHAGTYACHLIPFSKTVLPCNLSIQVDSHELEGRPASSFEPTAEGTSTNAPHEADTILLGAVIGLSVTLAVFVVGCVIIFFIRKWLWKTCRRLRVCLVSHPKTSDRDQVSSAEQAADTLNEHQIKDDQHVPRGSAQSRFQVENNNLSSYLQSDDAVRKSKSEMERSMSSAEDSEERPEAALKMIESSAESEANSRAVLLNQQQKQQKRRRRKRTTFELSQTSYKSVETDSDAADVSDTQDDSV